MRLSMTTTFRVFIYRSFPLFSSILLAATRARLVNDSFDSFEDPTFARKKKRLWHYHSTPLFPFLRLCYLFSLFSVSASRSFRIVCPELSAFLDLYIPYLPPSFVPRQLSAYSYSIPPTKVKLPLMSTPPTPQTILIVGSGVFGLSTAYALALRPSFSNTKITVLDRSPFPSPDGSSIDTSRIIRPDYHDRAYAALAAAAQDEWRKQGPNDLGGEGRYTESGLLLVANKGQNGEEYVRGSLENVISLYGNGKVQELKTRAEIEKTVGIGGGSGNWGYVNWTSGWADAEAGMRYLRKKVEALNRISFQTATVESLFQEGKKVKGVKTSIGETIIADLVILATGAWTGKLVDLKGRAQATGQVLCYLDITEEEQETLGKMPVFLNMSTGMFIIPPRNRLLKVARHGYGYTNTCQIPCPSQEDGKTIACSLPYTKTDNPNLWVPLEGETACREALTEMIPSLADRPFSSSKICWYTDTPNGDFLITYHPDYEGVFLATGGSGHGYKFLPVIGEKIVDCVEGKCPGEFKEKWCWPKEKVENCVTEDGSRGGRAGMKLGEEMERKR